jgi:FkbM family methyltransferase
MTFLEATVRLWQKAPSSWRHGLVKSRGAPFLRRVSNALHPNGPQVFTLAEPLAGHCMRLDWRSHKAYVFGTYEWGVVRGIQESVEPGHTAVDAGAHIGYFTLLLAKRVGEQGKVIAFEPWPENCQALRENVALNGYRNVVVENKAVGGRSTRVTLRPGRDGPLPCTGSIGSDEGLEVHSVSLDDYFGERGEKVSFVKMDIEGAEADALEGARATLDRHRPVLLIELHGFDPCGERHPALSKLADSAYHFDFLSSPGVQVHILARPRT